MDGKRIFCCLVGSITLFQSCLSHIPSYFLLLFKVVALVVTRLEKLQRDFLWLGIVEGKKDHLLRQEVVCRSKEQGGLGFGRISLRNCALLGKWLWRFSREGEGLWHKVIASIYGTHPNGWDANTVVRWSHKYPWKAIAQFFNMFFQFTRLAVGNGERIRFWEDLWWGDQSFCSQYPDLYRVIYVRNLSILVVLGPSPPPSLDLQFRRNLTDLEIGHLQSLLSSIVLFIFLPLP